MWLVRYPSFRRDRREKLTASEIVTRLQQLDRYGSGLVIVTGGEPTLQWDAVLATAIAEAGFRVHMESNGTHALAAPVDWLTISPKPQFHAGDFPLASALPASEIKVVVDKLVNAATLADYEQRWSCEQRFVQPCMDERHREHLARAIALAIERPAWRLSLQLHSLMAYSRRPSVGGLLVGARCVTAGYAYVDVT